MNSTYNLTIRLTPTILLASVACMLSTAVPCAAVVLPGPTFEEHVGVTGTGDLVGASLLVPELVRVDHFEPGSGQGVGFALTTGEHRGGAEVELEISATVDNPFARVGGTADATTRYGFAVVPLADGLPDVVPIVISAHGAVSVGTSVGFPLDRLGEVFARVDHPFGQFQASNCTASGCTTGGFAFDESVDGPVPVNAVGLMTLRARGHAEPSSGEFISFRAVVDPVIAIDPTFPFRDQYRIVFSDGILGPSPSSFGAPEPSALLLLASGLGGLAGRAWTRRARR